MHDFRTCSPKHTNLYRILGVYIGTAPLNIDRKECHVTLDNIPAWICGQCGEAYFRAPLPSTNSGLT
ncbi:MAG: YgiT-type zinc finger protein [Pseudomonadota bacterium]